MSQLRDFPQILACAIPLRFHTGWLQFFRSGTSVQAVLSLSSISTSMFRPLRSTVITRFSATMGLSDSRQRPTLGYLFPRFVAATAGPPGSSTDLSTRAAPFHPEESDDCSHPLLHRRFQASSFSGRLATPTLRNEAETSSLALRLACSPCKASPVQSLAPTLARLLVERAIYKISSFQNIRSARLILAHQRRKGKERF